MSVLLDLAAKYVRARQEAVEADGAFDVLQHLPPPDWEERRAERRELFNARETARQEAKHASANLSNHVVVLCRRLGYLLDDEDGG